MAVKHDDISDDEFRKMLLLMNSIGKPKELLNMTHSVMLEASKPISKKVKKTSISTVIRNVEAIDPVEAWKEKLRIIFLVGEPGSDGVSLAEELRMKLGHHLISSGKAIKIS